MKAASSDLRPPAPQPASSRGARARTPLVTVGLPVFNSSRYLRQSLESLLGQTFSDFVLLISDNASTDSTRDICSEYAAHDSRIRYHRNDRNIGNPRNFNRIARLTATPYLKWSTADDYWHPDFLEKAVAVMEADRSVALCYPQATLVDANGLDPRPYDDVLHLVEEDPAYRFLAVISRIKLVHQHLGLIRMSCLRRTRLLGAYIGSDVNLLAELSLYGKFVELAQRMYFRRIHERSGSWKRGDARHQRKHYFGPDRRDERLPTWRMDLGFLLAVQRAPIPMLSRLRIYPTLAKRVVWHRHALIGELMDGPLAFKNTLGPDTEGIGRVTVTRGEP